jgi:hypothetical protein
VRESARQNPEASVARIAGIDPTGILESMIEGPRASTISTTKKAVRAKRPVATGWGRPFTVPPTSDLIRAM